MQNRMHDQLYMQRCFDLARMGLGAVSPNPPVGAVLVYEDRIIGEGYHQRYGEAHAERNAIESIAPDDRHLLPYARLYVSLEPCCHQGKQPPCTKLILESGIREVIVSVGDPNPIVAGRGVAALRAHGITVQTGICEIQGQEVIRYFSTAKQQQRPYVLLKVVQSHDGYIGLKDKQIWLSNDAVRVATHRLRAEVDAILAGTNTVMTDNPQLTTRYWAGKNPIRVIMDRQGRIPRTHHVFDGSARTIVFSSSIPTELSSHLTEVCVVPFDADLIKAILNELSKRRIQSLLVEGGAHTITGFLDANLWDEAWIIHTPHIIGDGIAAPVIEGSLKHSYTLGSNTIYVVGR